jgi:hypothetical protein
VKTHATEDALSSANPVSSGTLASLDLQAAEAELWVEIVATSVTTTVEPALEATPSRRRLRRRRALLGLAGAMALAAAAAALLLVGGGASESPPHAYGAELVRFAESTPLLLLEGPGWRVQNVDEYKGGEGQMEFVTGKPIPYESIRVTGNAETGERESGMFPAAVRQRRVELSWHDGSPRRWLRFWKWRADGVAVGKWTTVPVLGTTAYVDTRGETFVNQRGPGNREMKAIWGEDGHVLEMSAAVPDLAGFKERLGWLHKVDSQTWLDAMPAKVVKAADHDAAVREMLTGIPLPPGFDPGKIPNEGLTTDRYQVGATVGGAVACEWFRRWGEAIRKGDIAVAKEAEGILQRAGSWPIFKEMSKEGAYPATVVELAEAMPSRHWYGRPLLPEVGQGLACPAKGFPLRSGGGRG